MRARNPPSATTDGGSPSYEGGAAFGAPIIEDVLAFRASVSFRRDGGWVDRVGYTLSPNNTVALPTPIYDGNTTKTNANYSETTTARLAVKWKVSDTLEITPSIYYQRLADQRHVGLLDRALESRRQCLSQRQRRDQPQQRPVHLECDQDQVGFGVRFVLLEHLLLR